MKAILAALLVCGSVALAQAPAAPSPELLNPASLTAQAPDQFRVNFATTAGDFVVEVRRAWAPHGADRFYNLVKAGFFTDAAFFRYVPDFVVQFGISPDPRIARAWYNAKISDDPVKQSNSRGTVVFATAGPNTRTTQLFVNLNDNAALDKQGFSAFGKVVQGMNIVQKLYKGYGEKPEQGRIENEGKAYLDKNFPKLDSVKSATVISEGAEKKK
jgi:peptidyl-prolyl cis-trans isomerase A (cyclophilin A)